VKLSPEWVGVGIAAGALVVSAASLWWSVHYRQLAARSAAAAEQSAAAAEQSARADEEARHQARTPRFALRFGVQEGDQRAAVLLLRGPAPLASVSFEVASRFADVQEIRGAVRRLGPWTNAGELGALDVGDEVALVVSLTDFWLRLCCTAADGEQWFVPVEVSARSTASAATVYLEQLAGTTAPPGSAT
jgi:hypothetical protein